LRTNLTTKLVSKIHGTQTRKAIPLSPSLSDEPNNPSCKQDRGHISQKKLGHDNPEKCDMHLESIVSFIDAWVGFVWNGFPQEFAQGLPAILGSMFQKMVLRNQGSYALVVSEKAFPELVSVFPLSIRPVCQDESYEGQVVAQPVLITDISCGKIIHLQPD
jgi:hypothetical protein